MALARRYQNNPCEVVSIIGDGAMTAGMAFEAMNDAVTHQADLMVVLNDNDMSISCSTGGFAKHLAAIWERGEFVNVTEDGEELMYSRTRNGFITRVYIKLQLMPQITCLKPLVLIILVLMMAMMLNNWYTFLKP